MTMIYTVKALKDLPNFTVLLKRVKNVSHEKIFATMKIIHVAIIRFLFEIT
jgi:hypothetical protein